MPAADAPAPFTLRPYQEEALQAIDHRLAAGVTRQVVVLPCGTGKSTITAQLPKLVGTPLLLLAHTDHLLDQHAEQMRRANPGVRLAIEQADRRADGTEDIVLASIPTLTARDARRLGRLSGVPWRVVVVDEVHHAPARTWRDTLGTLGCLDQTGPPLIGTSVAPDTPLCVRHKQTGAMRILTIQELATIHSAAPNSITPIHEYEIQTLGRDGIYWAPIEAIHRYTNRKKLITIRTQLGRHITVTNDHSLFSVTPSGPLELREAGTLSTGDYLVIEDQIAVTPTATTVDVWRHGDPTATLLGGCTAQQVRGLIAGHKRPYKRLRGPHGPCLRLHEALRHNIPILPTHRLYTEGAQGRWCPAVLPTRAIAWLLGYVLGNGWIGSKRLTISVPTAKLTYVMDRLNDLPSGLRWRPRPMAGSVELRLSCRPFVDLFAHWIGGKRANTKSIPGDCLTWDDESRRLLALGLLDSDGSIRHHDTPRRRNTRIATITTTSPAMALQLRYLLCTLGVQAAIRTQPGLRGPHQTNGTNFPAHRIVFATRPLFQEPSPNWRLPVAAHNRAKLKLQHGSALKITAIEPADHVSEVFDLSIPDTERFFANGFLAHNTATPRRGDGVGLHELFQEIVYQKNLREMIDDGWCCDIRAYAVHTDVDLDRVKIQHGDFAEGSLASAVNTPGRNAIVVEAWRRLAQHRRTLVFCANVVHAESLALSFRRAGIDAQDLTGRLHRDERHARLQAFRDGRIPVLTSVNIISESYDDPPLSCLVLARPTKSPLLFEQQIGRGTRIFENKTDSLVLDVVDVSRRHKLQTVASLFGLPASINLRGRSAAEAADRVERALSRHPSLQPELFATVDQLLAEAERLSLDIRKVELVPQLAAEVQREAALAWIRLPSSEYALPLAGRVQIRVRENLLEQWEVVLLPDRTVLSAHATRRDAFAAAEAEIAARDPERARFARHRAAWRRDPVSDEQRRVLEAAGVPIPATKGEASQLIDQLVEQRQSKWNQPATPRQRWRLKREGMWRDGMTRGEAGAAIKEIRKREQPHTVEASVTVQTSHGRT